jgi:hypothetical protein
MSIDDQDTMRGDVRRILDRTQDAIREIEIKAEQIGDLMLEINDHCLEGDLPESAEAFADQLSRQATALVRRLGVCFEELRNNIAVVVADDD